MEILTVAISVVGSALTALGVAWLTIRGNRPAQQATAEKDRATAAREITDAATDMLDRMEKRLGAVESLSNQQADTITVLQTSQRKADVKIAFLTDRVATLTTGVRILTSQVIELGGRPRWADDVNTMDWRPPDNGGG